MSSTGDRAFTGGKGGRIYLHSMKKKRVPKPGKQSTKTVSRREGFKKKK